MSKKKYTVCCPHCNHRVFDADYADVEIKCPECRKVFKEFFEETMKVLQSNHPISE